MFVQMMKQEHSQLSCEAHDCADSIPELNKMVTGVQALGRFDYTISWLVFEIHFVLYTLMRLDCSCTV